MSAAAASLLFVLAAATGAVLRAQLGSLNDRTADDRTADDRAADPTADDRLPGRLAFPLGTLIANLAASFALGAAQGLDGTAQAVIGAALLGALSTWSTLANEIHQRWRNDARRHAWAVLAISLVGGISLAWIGLRVAPQ